MTRIYLLRHTDALPGSSDARRKLSGKGRQDASSLGQQLVAAQTSLPLKIFHSSLVRARETGELLIEGLQPKPILLEKEGLTPGDNPHETFLWLRERKEHTMIIGHNPFLEQLAGWLMGNDPFAGPVTFRKGTFLCLEKQIIPHPKQGPFQRWSVKWLLLPKLCAPFPAKEI
ncbi:MAG: histidine phosphatase family protein [Opitutales bacterium]|nr:histidine phosphatase family protein [Opitutales bacterium]